jgi:large subunit ribosomal protein L17
MRHRVDHRKLNRTSSHKKAMLRNMVTSLFDKERITTTDAKAKEAKRFAERLITSAKKGYTAHKEVQTFKAAGNEPEARQMQAVALAHWRHAARFIQKKTVLKKLFNDLAPLYIDREGGYTRILRLGTRPGDNAQSVMLELVGTEITSKPRTRKPRKKKVEEGTREDVTSTEAATEQEPVAEAEAQTSEEAADDNQTDAAAEHKKDEKK